MTSKQKDIAWKTVGQYLLGNAIGASIGFGIMAGVFYYQEHKNDEKGTIVYKENYELAVDLDGDKQPDRLLRMLDVRLENKTFYNYAHVGDKISYVNKQGKSILDGEYKNLEIQKVNGKTFPQICEWNELNKRVKMKTR